MTRKVLGSALLIVMTLLAGARSAQGFSIDFVAPAQTVDLGDAVSVALVVSGLGDLTAPSLGAFDLDVSFNAGVLSFTGATYGDPALGDQLDLFALGSLTATTPGAGTVNLFQLSFDPPADLDALQAGSFTLATLSFNTLSAGLSALGLSSNALSDGDGGALVALLGTGSITVQGVASPVPAPATWLLFGVGVVLAAGVVRRRATAPARA